MKYLKEDRDGGHLYTFKDDDTSSHFKPRSRSNPAPKVDVRALAKEMENLRGQMTSELLTSLAASTGLPEESWRPLRVGWATRSDLNRLHVAGSGSWRESNPEGAFAIAESDGKGRIIGISFRTLDGLKGSAKGSQRGLVVPDSSGTGPTLVVEGASDVAACNSMGLRAVGRPSNSAGAAFLDDYLEGEEILVVGENDRKADGSWPGREGAKTIASKLAGLWGKQVSWSLPPDGAKDIRAYYQQHVVLGSTDPRLVGRELLRQLKASKQGVKPKKPAADPEDLVSLAMELYDFGKTETGEVFAVSKDGPRLAQLFRRSSGSFKADLALAYKVKNSKTCGSDMFESALRVLEGLAMKVTAVPVAIRVGSMSPAASDMSDVSDMSDDQLGLEPGVCVLDLGRDDGQVVVIDPQGWELRRESSLLFQRTALTSELPLPQQDVDSSRLLEFKQILNVTEKDWPLVVGWMVASLLPDIPHPILMLGGEQGTGKSTAARLVAGLIDPSSAPLRSEPRNPEELAVSASNSWIVCLDNLSRICPWLSDALCKAVTGDGHVRRKLYTDGEPAVMAYRRCIMLTSIDPGSLRGDLGERLLMVELERIHSDARKTESRLNRQYQRLRPVLLGALLTAVSRILAALPQVSLDEHPRMADFAQVLAALDQACPELTGGQAYESFMKQRGRISQEVVEADPVASALVACVQEKGEFRGSASELLELLTPDNPLRGWPGTPQAMGQRLKRIAPDLRELSLEVSQDKESDSHRKRLWIVRYMGDANVRNVRSSGASEDGQSKPEDQTDDPVAPEPRSSDTGGKEYRL
ncbi:hypothetical protein [Mucisphaera sp.]|uniref:ATP-binding protein n=1 Tax=Mucisphaera sp. TaxID=2913024 RepID=UPI003D1431A0